MNTLKMLFKYKYDFQAVIKLISKGCKYVVQNCFHKYITLSDNPERTPLFINRKKKKV